MQPANLELDAGPPSQTAEYTASTVKRASTKKEGRPSRLSRHITIDELDADSDKLGDFCRDHHHRIFRSV